jgi:hypothetical protein
VCGVRARVSVCVCVCLFVCLCSICVRVIGHACDAVLGGVVKECAYKVESWHQVGLGVVVFAV